MLGGADTSLSHSEGTQPASFREFPAVLWRAPFGTRLSWLRGNYDSGAPVFPFNAVRHQRYVYQFAALCSMPRDPFLRTGVEFLGQDVVDGHCQKLFPAESVARYCGIIYQQEAQCLNV